jgi:hypothetical protein
MEQGPVVERERVSFDSKCLAVRERATPLCSGAPLSDHDGGPTHRRRIEVLGRHSTMQGAT